MKIGIDVRCLMEKHYSGISEYTYNLLKSLLTIDQQNQYLLFYNSSKPVEMPEFNNPNVSYRGFSYPNRVFNLAMRFLKKPKIDELLGGVDVFITPSFLFSNLSDNCRQILIVHDLSFELYPNFFTAKKKLWHRLINPRAMTRRADEIIAISENTKADLVQIYQVPSTKVKVVYNGINQIFFQPIAASQLDKVKAKYKLHNPFILYLGNLEPRKNVATLLKAFEKISNQSIDLVIAGSQAWKYQNLYKIWEQSAVRERIKFLGYVDDPDRPALYALAKLFVYPSIYEGFGLPPLEAMACGTPVITSFNSALIESVGDAGLLIDPHNVNDLVSAINNILTDEDFRNRLATQGLSYSKNFTWEKAAMAIQEIINRSNL
ncbi:MAG: glycosyltransferase family 1 protein [Patescibacteria group bacterium]|jgi:glycosyltransferase involved in cell wall biosynthesis|nr:glycosyltransferase family 1 protein [Patescibacteria group bacterium]